MEGTAGQGCEKDLADSVSPLSWVLPECIADVEEQFKAVVILWAARACGQNKLHIATDCNKVILAGTTKWAIRAKNIVYKAWI